MLRAGCYILCAGGRQQAGVLLRTSNGASVAESSRWLPAWARRGYKSDGAIGVYTFPRCVRSAAAWEKCVGPGFHAFLKVKKHMLVPQNFVVPHGDDAWPREAWGYPLGKHSVWLRKQKRDGKEVPAFAEDDLKELGFAWAVSQYKWDYFIMPSLRRFYDLYGHTDVSKTFTVPVGDAKWPEHLWGHYLGRSVDGIRSMNTFAAQVEASSKELDAMEFCYRTTLAERDWNCQILPSLEMFRQVRGHCDMERSFVVPSEPPWPEKAWGLKLGTLVSNMRTKGIYAAQAARDKDVLEDLGFVWSHCEADWSGRVLPALQMFSRVHGHCRVPQTFVVPPEAPWPERTWNLNVGMAAHQMRFRGTYAAQVARDKDILDELDFVWS